MNTFDYWFDYIKRNGTFSVREYPFLCKWEIEINNDKYAAHVYIKHDSNECLKLIEAALYLLERDMFSCVSFDEKYAETSFIENNPEHFRSLVRPIL